MLIYLKNLSKSNKIYCIISSFKNIKIFIGNVYR